MNAQEKKNLIYNAVLDGWTAKMLINGELQLTKPKSKISKNINFDSKRFINKLKKK